MDEKRWIDPRELDAVRRPRTSQYDDVLAECEAAPNQLRVVRARSRSLAASTRVALVRSRRIDESWVCFTRNDRLFMAKLEDDGSEAYRKLASFPRGVLRVREAQPEATAGAS